MPRIDILDSDFDFENFERISKIKPNGQKANPRPVYKTRLRPLAARRELGQHDSLPIKSLVSAALEGLDQSDRQQLSIIENLGTSLLTASEARLILRRTGADRSERSLKRINHKVLKSINAVNASRSQLFPRLGQIDIFGAHENHGDELKRFIGPVIDIQAEKVADERETLLRSVIPPDNAKLWEELGDFVPHVSLVKTENEAVAQRVAEALSSAGISGKWVTLMQVMPNKV